MGIGKCVANFRFAESVTQIGLPFDRRGVVALGGYLRRLSADPAMGLDGCRNIYGPMVPENAAAYMRPLLDRKLPPRTNHGAR